MLAVQVNFAAVVNRIFKKMGCRVVRSGTVENLQIIKELQTLEFTKKYNNLENRIEDLETTTKSANQAIENLIRYAMKSHWRTIDIIEQHTGTESPVECQLCGYQSTEQEFEPIQSECIFLGGRLLRHRCPSCEVIFGAQKYFAVDNEMLDLEYLNLYRIYSEETVTASIIRTFHLLKPQREKIYLDFGCGGEWSDAISQLRQQGWNIYGFEPSASNSSDYIFSTWEEVSAYKFDGIFTHNVLEHFLNPIEMTQRIRDLLTPDGRIVHATACFDYRYEYSRFHVFFFTGRSPEILAERSGMKIIEWVRDGIFIACIMDKC